MKNEYIDTPFGDLISSYLFLCDGLSDEDVEKALRVHAKKWSGCISCRYSQAHPEARERKGNIWYQRTCQVGLTQDGCEMYEKFPEAENRGDAKTESESL